MKKRPKLTHWFGSDIKPARDGVYEVRMTDGRSVARFAWFEYGEWSNSFVELSESNLLRGWTSGAFQNKEWRGLAQDPSKQ